MSSSTRQMAPKRQEDTEREPGHKPCGAVGAEADLPDHGREDAQIPRKASRWADGIADPGPRLDSRDVAVILLALLVGVATAFCLLLIASNTM